LALVSSRASTAPALLPAVASNSFPLIKLSTSTTTPVPGSRVSSALLAKQVSRWFSWPSLALRDPQVGTVFVGGRNGTHLDQAFAAQAHVEHAVFANLDHA